jgi:multicomponent Na+:H+ antiporter subunit G
MLAVAVDFADLAITTRVVLIIAFVFLTAPISAQMIGRAAYFVGVPLWQGTTMDELQEHNGRHAPPEDAVETRP